MMFIKENGRCSQSDLQTELKIDSAAVTRHLKNFRTKELCGAGKGTKTTIVKSFVEITPKAKQELSRLRETPREGSIRPIADRRRSSCVFCSC